MKALIIENEYRIDEAVEEFLQDNLTLFENVTELVSCLARKEDEILHNLLTHDTYIVASTFTYSSQLEKFLELFLKPEFPIKTLFVNNIVNRLNNWKYNKTAYLRNYKVFDSVVKILEKGFILNDYYEGEDGVIYSKVSFSKEDEIFYHSTISDATHSLNKENAIKRFK